MKSPVGGRSNGFPETGERTRLKLLEGV